MFESDYFQGGLRQQVEQLDGKAIVNVTLHNGGTLYIRDVVNTEKGIVTLNVWHGSGGRPIESPSSDAFSQEVPSGYHQVALAFESISMVDVAPVDENVWSRLGFSS